jgi:nucleoside-diphosphate-sugar epimerase
MKQPLINTVEDLEHRLSAPIPADIEAMSAITGNILILGVAGKMGPSLAKLARRAVLESGTKKRIIAVARFSSPEVKCDLEKAGIETIACDLLKPGALTQLPDIENVIFMAARKFGTSGAEHLTWAMNVFLPGLVAERYRSSCIVAFSTGNVYALQPVSSGGATETTPVSPVGEYAQSALGRERMFEYGAHQWGTRVVLLRLNYAVELRYGVLVDIAHAVYNRRPVDLRMGYVNVIWQRDANSACLRSLALGQSPPLVLNITGPEMLSVREIAEQFGKRFGVTPQFQGHESDVAILSNAAKASALFGIPTVSPDQLIDWIAHWISRGSPLLNKPTHFQVQDGKF